MRKIAAAAAIILVAGTSACKKTGEGEYEVQQPVIGVETDTVRTPTIGTTQDTITVPRIDVRKDTVIVTRPIVKRP